MLKLWGRMIYCTCINICLKYLWKKGTSKASFALEIFSMEENFLYCGGGKIWMPSWYYVLRTVVSIAYCLFSSEI